eukprot:ANDGO_00681.mRNA.1 5'-AMP-activated protein kinase subunit gamma
MEGAERILDFLSKRTLYDMMPHSCKVVVYDVDLRVKDAFRGAVEHEMTFATLWDGRIKDFVGMLTVTDFIDIMLYFRQVSQGDPSRMLMELEEYRICTWRGMQKRNRPNKLLFADPEESLLSAAVKLRHNRIHRLPVLDRDENAKSLLYIVTHSRMMDDIVRHFDFSMIPLVQRSIEELGVGTFSDPVTVPKHAKLDQVLRTLSQRSISAVPVVGADGVAIDIYSRTDVMDLAADRFYNLDATVAQALEHRRVKDVHKGERTLHTCTRKDSLASVMTRLVNNRVHRLVCVDAGGRVVGIVSMSDIFDFFLDQQPGYSPPPKRSAGVAQPVSTPSQPASVTSSAAFPSQAHSHASSHGSVSAVPFGDLKIGSHGHSSAASAAQDAVVAGGAVPNPTQQFDEDLDVDMRGIRSNSDQDMFDMDHA